MSGEEEVEDDDIEAEDNRASDSPLKRKKALPRLYHKKSRNGCHRCRARRVKCNEARPVCNNCHRHGVSCTYKASQPVNGRDKCVDPVPRLQPYTAASPSEPQLLPVTHSSKEIHEEAVIPCIDGEQNINIMISIPESKARRLLEHRLLLNFVSHTCPTLPASHDARVLHAWSVDVPDLALQHESLLYSVLSISALYLVRTSSSSGDGGDNEPDPALVAAHRRYLGLALHGHREGLAQLNIASADPLCFTSMLILYNAVATLHDRPLQSYSPPMEWLQMARGARSVFDVACTWVQQDVPDAKIHPILQAAPRLDDADADALFAAGNCESYADLLLFDRDSSSGSEGGWESPETRDAYEKTLAYIGSVQRAIDAGEHPLAVCRRFMAFATVVPPCFIQCVQDMQPRALVVLAHHFALVAGVDRSLFWWLGHTTSREIRGILSVLPAEWHGLMRGPLAAISSGGNGTGRVDFDIETL